MARNALKQTPIRLGSGRLAKYKKTLVLLTMVAPAAIWLLLLRYLPMGGIILAFKDYKINPRNPSFIMMAKATGMMTPRMIKTML